MTDKKQALVALDYIQHDWQQKDGQHVFQEQCEEIRAYINQFVLIERIMKVLDKQSLTEHEKLHDIRAILNRAMEK